MRHLRAFLFTFLCLLLAAPTFADDLRLKIIFDDTAVRQLLTLIEEKDAADNRLDAWLDLPANQNLLRVGEAEGSLTRERLKANAKAVIEGTANPRTQPREDAARLFVTDTRSYRKMLDDLQASAEARAARITQRLNAFCPDSVKRETWTQTVYLHLGGSWDALNRQDAVYINVHYWHDYNRPSWEGLNMIVAHETMHTIQNRAFGNPEFQDTGERSFFSALSKIQREGIARYVEVETDPEAYQPYTYGFFYRAVDQENLRAFDRDLTLLTPLTAATMPVFDKEKFAEVYGTGMDSGGPFYDVGHGIAKAIDERSGRKVLLKTITDGPKAFFTEYARLTEKDKALPRLPETFLDRLKEIKERY